MKKDDEKEKDNNKNKTASFFVGFSKRTPFCLEHCKGGHHLVPIVVVSPRVRDDHLVDPGVQAWAHSEYPVHERGFGIRRQSTPVLRAVDHEAVLLVLISGDVRQRVLPVVLQVGVVQCELWSVNDDHLNAEPQGRRVHDPQTKQTKEVRVHEPAAAHHWIRRHHEDDIERRPSPVHDADGRRVIPRAFGAGMMTDVCVNVAFEKDTLTRPV